MKKIILLVLLALLLTFSSCIPATHPSPIGVWKNSEYGIIFYIQPEYAHRDSYSTYLGLYRSNDDATKIFVRFGRGARVSVFYATGSQAIHFTRDLLFGADFRVINDELRLDLRPSGQERFGVYYITFHLLEYYDPPNPADWLSP